MKSPIYRPLWEPVLFSGVPRMVFFLCLSISITPNFFQTTPYTLGFSVILMVVLIVIARYLTKKDPFWFDMIRDSRRYPRRMGPYRTAVSKRVKHEG